MENPYESEKLLSEYLLFHYGSPEEILPPSAPAGMREALDFPTRTCSRFSPGGMRGLDLGCAVGRSTYEMSRTCEHVLGIDYSHAFIRAAETLRTSPVPYRRHDEAHRSTPLEAQLPDGVHPQKVQFRQGDAMNLPADLGTFDRLHAANLLCRLPNPEHLLQRLPSLMNPGGELILATPCTWLGEFTPMAHWPKGPTLDWLRDHLTADFHLVDVSEEPFLIRETSRKFQWTSSQVTLWRRHETDQPLS
ncbi:putative 4-mercaptohistidine N1-methyltransferase [Haloferula luteola]|uniref:Putative 4-mercaptohistidine N1-methyltransferase n=1 Tax=Haloferula luteola TaxID=595692 RepID=A0A840VAD0_9BACT|nr:methyltransferase domain-containing protein [Haloferula luteola]MBB5351638.1 putative 4-mercaptohistidine N1-methyltransferase [Haloferula luteola]